MSQGKGRAVPARVIRAGLSGEVSSEGDLGSEKGKEEHSKPRGQWVQRQGIYKQLGSPEAIFRKVAGGYPAHRGSA